MATATQSKLMMQLQKEQLISQRDRPDEKRLEDVYNIACKAEPGNMRLAEFLTLVLEKGLMTNANGLRTFSGMFEQFSNKSIESDALLNISKGSSIVPDEEKKFHRQKFIRTFVDLAKRLYPADENAFEKLYYNRLVGIDGEDGRMRLDETIKKFLTRDTVKYLLEFEEDLQRVFVIYIPENYNRGLDFSWHEAKMLERRLPVVCLVRFLAEVEICPNFLSVSGIFEMIAKYLPPANSNHRQVIFYSAETAANYVKEHMSNNTIKLIEGDIGLTFNEFQLIMLRIAFELSKDNQQKVDFLQMIRKLLQDIIGLRPSSGALAVDPKRKTKFHTRLQTFSKGEQDRNSKHLKKKSQSHIEEDIDILDEEDAQESRQDADLYAKLKNVKANFDIDLIKKSLDEDTPQIPEPQKCNKQNEGIYDIEERYVVIGQQLPKIQQKAKMAAPKPNKKEPDELLGYKAELPKPKTESYSQIKEMMNSAYRVRKASQYYPVLLSEVASAESLNPESRVYVQTAFISLAERDYQNALSNLKEARNTQKTSRLENEIFFFFIEGQIYEAMNRDDLALDRYYKCKEVAQGLKNGELCAALPFCGLGSCLYHAQQYEYAIRCFLKAKEIREKAMKNCVEMANLFNNIGCCLLKLERAHQARKQFELSYSILDLQLGAYHQKTLTVHQNLSKAKKAYTERIPQYKVLWRSYETKEWVVAAPKKKK